MNMSYYFLKVIRIAISTHTHTYWLINDDDDAMEQGHHIIMMMTQKTKSECVPS